MNALIIKLKNETTLIAEIVDVSYTKDKFGNKIAELLFDSENKIRLYNPQTIPEYKDWMPYIRKIDDNFVVLICDDDILTIAEPSDETLEKYLNAIYSN